MLLSTFLEKITLVFSWLTFYPDILENWLKVSIPYCIWFSVTSQKRSKSLANIRWESVAPYLLIFIVFQLLFLTSYSIKCDSSSMHNIKVYGDNISPCLMPRWGLMYLFRAPFQFTLVSTLVTPCMIMLIVFWGRFISFNTRQINSQLNLSHAFVKSCHAYCPTHCVWHLSCRITKFHKVTITSF